MFTSATILASLAVMREAAAWCRARRGPAFVHAHVIRPYSHSLSDDETLYRIPAERQADARRDPLVAFPTFLREEGVAREEELAALREEVDREVNAAADAALAAPAPDAKSAPLYVYSPDVDPTSDAFKTEPRPVGDPKTMVDLLNACLHDEMARNDAVVVFGEDVADCSREESLPAVKGKGGVFKVTHSLQTEVRLVARVQHAAGRGQHRRPRHRHGRPRAEARGRDPVLRLHLAGLHADPQRAGRRSAGARTATGSCPMVIRVPIGGYLQGGAIWHSQCGEVDLHPHPRAARGHPVQRPGRERPAAHGHPLRRPRPVPRAQAPLPPDLQQGPVPGAGLHDPVREGGARARGHRPHGDHVRRARAALAGGGPSGGGGRPRARDPRPALARALRLGGDRGERQEDGQGPGRARGQPVRSATARRSRPASATSSSSTSTRPCAGWARSTPSSGTTPPWKTRSCPRCGTCSRPCGSWRIRPAARASRSPPARTGLRCGPRRRAPASTPRRCRSPRSRSCGGASPA